MNSQRIDQTKGTTTNGEVEMLVRIYNYLLSIHYRARCIVTSDYRQKRIGT